MKDNYIKLKDENGNAKEYRILFNIEDTSNEVNYLIYTNDTKNKAGELKVYASTYVKNDKGNMTKSKPVESKEEFEFIEKILKSLEEDNEKI